MLNFSLRYSLQSIALCDQKYFHFARNKNQFWEMYLKFSKFFLIKWNTKDMVKKLRSKIGANFTQSLKFVEVLVKSFFKL